MTGNQYWIKSNGSIRGPLQAGQLKTLALQGLLQPSDLVSSDKRKWVKATSVKGLDFGHAQQNLKPVSNSGDQDEYSLESLEPEGTPSELVRSRSDRQSLVNQHLFANEPQPSPPQDPEDSHPGMTKRMGNLVILVLSTLASVTVLAGLIWIVVAANRDGEKIQLQLPDWRDEEWTPYIDPQGRFSCSLPPGWDVASSHIEDQSEVQFVHGDMSIQVTVRETARREIYDGFEEEMLSGMEEVAKQAGYGGGVVDHEWTKLGESDALRIDINSKFPPTYASTLKSKHRGLDHFIGFYKLGSSIPQEHREFFEEFRSRYGTYDDILVLEKVGASDNLDATGAGPSELSILAALDAIQSLGLQDQYAEHLVRLLDRDEPRILMRVISILAQDRERAERIEDRLESFLHNEDRGVGQVAAESLLSLGNSNGPPFSAVDFLIRHGTSQSSRVKALEALPRFGDRAIPLVSIALTDERLFEHVSDVVEELKGDADRNDQLGQSLFGLRRKLSSKDSEQNTSGPSLTELDSILDELGFSAEKLETLLRPRQLATLGWTPDDWKSLTSLNSNDPIFSDLNLIEEFCVSPFGRFVAVRHKSNIVIASTRFPDRLNHRIFESTDGGIEFSENGETLLVIKKYDSRRDDYEKVQWNSIVGDSVRGIVRGKWDRPTPLQSNPSSVTFPVFGRSMESTFSAPEGVELTTVLMSPDGRYLVAGGTEGELLFVNATDLVLDYQIKIGGGPIDELAISNNGRLVVARQENTLRMLSCEAEDASDQNETAPKLAEYESANLFANAPLEFQVEIPVGGWQLLQYRIDDGAWITDETAWTEPTPKAISITLDGGRHQLELRTIDLNGKSSKVSTNELIINEWVETEVVSTTMVGKASIVFSPDAALVGVANDETNSALLIDASTGETVEEFDLGRPVLAMSFSSDGSYFTANSDHTSLLFDVEKDRVVYRDDPELAVKGEVRGRRAVFESIDHLVVCGDFLIAGASRGTVKAVYIGEGRRRRLESEALVEGRLAISHLARIPSTNVVVGLDRSTRALVAFDVSDEVRAIETELAGRVEDIVLPPSGKTKAEYLEWKQFDCGETAFAVAKEDRVYFGKLHRSDERVVFEMISVANYSQEIIDIDVSPSSTEFVIVLQDGTLQVMDASTARLQTMVPVTSPVLSAAYVEGGSKIATHCADGIIRIWHLKTY